MSSSHLPTPVRLLLFTALVISSACGSGTLTAPGAATPSVGETTPPSPLAIVVEVKKGGVIVLGTGIVGGGGVGQSVTIPSGPIADVHFSWYQRSNLALQPVAFGTLYVLSQEYLGRPAELSPSTPGFIGRSQGIVDNEYVFDATVKLQPSTKYWFYTDSEGDYSSGEGDMYPGGDLYGIGANGFVKFVVRSPTDFQDANFTVRGRAVR